MRCNTGANPPGAEFVTPEQEAMNRVIQKTNETTEAINKIIKQLQCVNETLTNIKNQIKEDVNNG